MFQQNLFFLEYYENYLLENLSNLERWTVVFVSIPFQNVKLMFLVRTNAVPNLKSHTVAKMS